MTETKKNKKSVGAAFVGQLCQDAMQSQAAQHPYLRALRNGEFPDMAFALQDFAVQYGHYSERFIRYMTAVIDNLGKSEHRRILLANLAEEQGDTHDIELPPDVLADIDGVPHKTLFRRFQSALGITDCPTDVHVQSPGRQWSDAFLALCQTDECTGVGAIGIGTELIVASIYAQILATLEAHSELNRTQRVFFELHSVCDDEHAAQIKLIAADLATTDTNCERMRFGVEQALQIRARFWDAMMQRAQERVGVKQTAGTRASTIGHQEGL